MNEKMISKSQANYPPPTRYWSMARVAGVNQTPIDYFNRHNVSAMGQGALRHTICWEHCLSMTFVRRNSISPGKNIEQIATSRIKRYALAYEAALSNGADERAVWINNNELTISSKFQFNSKIVQNNYSAYSKAFTFITLPSAQYTVNTYVWCPLICVSVFVR